MRWISRGVRLSVVVALLASTLFAVPAGADSQQDAQSDRSRRARQNDAGSGKDAGDTFEKATKVKPRGFYKGRLDADADDRDDFYKFFLPEGGSVSVLIEFPAATVDPITMLDPSGTVVDVGTKVQGAGVTVSSGLTSEVGAVRLAVHRAAVAGQYRLHLQSDQFDLGEYEMCFLNCEEPQRAPIELIFGGSLETPDARVLLVPPSHGDLGNPFGPTVTDYLDATLRGMRRWKKAMKDFANDFPQFSYLKDIDIHIEIFDGAEPVNPVGYDVIIGYVAAGPAFRGVAGDFGGFSLGDDVRFSGRVIALSLFGSSPRAGQVLYDFPEVNDLEIVTAHEFGHTFGLGHTTTWHKKLGPDLMNSPAPFVYGDGFPAGDGGEHTKMKCLSSLDLYGMAHLYRWLPNGEWEGSSGTVDLPNNIPYRWYC